MGLVAQKREAPPSEDTIQLVARARGGDRLAFSRLLEDHYDLIYRAAYRWTGHRQDAEDIAQEVCIKLGRALESFDNRSAFSSWVYRITLNAVRDLQRARSRRGRGIDRLAEVTPDDSPPDQEDAAAMGELWAAVRRLPEKQRDAVLLIYAEDMTHAAAAQIMGCAEATVSWHIHEAKKTLRGLL